MEPTRQQAALDPIIIPDDMSYLDSGTFDIPSSISDHKATYIKIPFHYQCQMPYERLVWMYKYANINLLKEKITTFDWDSLLNGTLDDACNTFTNTFLDIAKSCIPSKFITVRSDDKPWYDNEIRRFSRKRDRLKSKSVQSRNPNDWLRYKQMRNKVNNLKKHAK